MVSCNRCGKKIGVIEGLVCNHLCKGCFREVEFLRGMDWNAERLGLVVGYVRLK